MEPRASRPPLLIAAACAGALVLFVGCSKKAPQAQSIVPLPPNAIDVAVLDAERLAVLIGSTSKAVMVVSRRDGATKANFAAPPQTVSLGRAGPNEFLSVMNERATSTLEVRSLGGELQRSVELPGRALSLAPQNGTLAYVLVSGSPPLIVDVDLIKAQLSGTVAAPPGAVSLSTGAPGPITPFLVGTADGSVYERIAGGTRWRRLEISGESPVYSASGAAIYTLHRIGDSRLVAITDGQSQLQVRLIPVALDTLGMKTSGDGALLVFEKTAKSANARFIPCGSPLLAIEPRFKRGKFFGGGAPWQLLGLATPDPGATGTPEPTATDSAEAGC
jgi:hypothetical protein